MSDAKPPTKAEIADAKAAESKAAAAETKAATENAKSDSAAAAKADAADGRKIETDKGAADAKGSSSQTDPSQADAGTPAVDDGGRVRSGYDGSLTSPRSDKSDLRTDPANTDMAARMKSDAEMNAKVAASFSDEDKARHNTAIGEREAAAADEAKAARAKDPDPVGSKFGDPGYELRPGDLGYAPPARIANETGVLTNEHLGYHPGQDVGSNVFGTTTLAMPAPADATVSSMTAMTKPSLIDKGTAAALLAKMSGDLQTWIMDNPHPMVGKLAVISQFFRDLRGREVAMGTAAQLGRSVAPDSVDKAEHAAPAEYFKLRQAASELITMQRIYETKIQGLGGQLTPEDKKTVDTIVGNWSEMSEGPATPEAVPGAADAEKDPKAA